MKLILRKKLSGERSLLCFCGIPLKLGPAGPVIHTEMYSYLVSFQTDMRHFNIFQGLYL